MCSFYIEFESFFENPSWSLHHDEGATNLNISSNMKHILVLNFKKNDLIKIGSRLNLRHLVSLEEKFRVF